MFTANQFESAEFRITPGTNTRKQLRRTGICKIHRAGHTVAEPLPAGTVRHERLAKRVVVVAPWIAEAAQENFALQGLRSHPPNATTLKSQNLVGCFHVRANVNRLIKIQPTIKSPTQGVQDMVRILRPKAGGDHFAFVRLAISIDVLEV